MDFEQLKFAAYGFLLGLCVAAWVAFNGWREANKLKKEVKRLLEHLNTQMEITYEGSATREQKLEQLRLENENLRISLQTWRQKPDRRDLRLLQVYDDALRQLLETAPGFAVHWESSRRQAEERVAQADRGLIAMTRRWLTPREPAPKEPLRLTEGTEIPKPK